MIFTLENFNKSDIVGYSSYVLGLLSGPLGIIIGVLLTFLIIDIIFSVFGRKIEKPEGLDENFGDNRERIENISGNLYEGYWETPEGKAEMFDRDKKYLKRKKAWENKYH